MKDQELAAATQTSTEEQVRLIIAETINTKGRDNGFFRRTSPYSPNSWLRLFSA